MEFKVPVEVNGDHYNFPGVSFSGYVSEDTLKLFVPSEISFDLSNPDIIRGDNKGVAWDYNYDYKILKYLKPVRLVKDTPATQNPSEIIQMERDSIP